MTKHFEGVGSGSGEVKEGPGLDVLGAANID
jgi:hypothetical protein